MFERMDFSFGSVFFKSTDIFIAYDEVEDKTYCTYICNLEKEGQDFCIESKDYVFEGHDFVTEIENCNFRKWYNLSCPFYCDGYHFRLKFNDKNKMDEERTGDNAYPDEFFKLLKVFKRHIPNSRFYEVSSDKERYEIYDNKNHRLLRNPIGWENKKKTLKLLEKLTDYIEIFENETNFGKWKPEPNSAHRYSSENYIKFTKPVKRFIKDVKEIADKCKDLDLYNSGDILDLLGIEEMNENVEKYFLDNRSAMLLIMHYMEPLDRKWRDYKFEEALKNGTIVRILKFIKKFNDFGVEDTDVFKYECDDDLEEEEND